MTEKSIHTIDLSRFIIMFYEKKIWNVFVWVDSTSWAVLIELQPVKYLHIAKNRMSCSNKPSRWNILQKKNGKMNFRWLITRIIPYVLWTRQNQTQWWSKRSFISFFRSFRRVKKNHSRQSLPLTLLALIAWQIEATFAVGFSFAFFYFTFTNSCRW